MLYRRSRRCDCLCLRQLTCGERASRAGAARAPSYLTERALLSQQDACRGAPIGVVARPASGGGGVRAHMPYVSARKGRPPATSRPAVPPVGTHATRRVYQPGLPPAARRPLLQRLSAGAHRPPDWARVAGSDLQNRHLLDGSSLLRRIGVLLRGVA